MSALNPKPHPLNTTLTAVGRLGQFKGKFHLDHNYNCCDQWPFSTGPPMTLAGSKKPCQWGPAAYLGFVSYQLQTLQSHRHFKDSQNRYHWWELGRVQQTANMTELGSKISVAWVDQSRHCSGWPAPRLLLPSRYPTLPKIIIAWRVWQKSS